MVRIDIDDRDCVTRIEFGKAVEPIRNQHRFGEVNHEETAAEIAEGDRAVESILIEAIPLKAELMDDPRFARRTNYLRASEAEEKAARRMTNRYLIGFRPIRWSRSARRCSCEASPRGARAVG